MTSFRLFAGTNIGLRGNNEDNFTVCRDLTLNDWVIPANQQEVIRLGERGCLAVVADGMGGQNAGEVASATAIETVQALFSPDAMPPNVVDKSDRIISYLKKVIVQADLRIKQRCANDSSVQGMGSTIVIVWLVRGKAYVGWLGDSRAYSYIPEKGISRITKDHSYVQQLVDAKVLSEEQAMNDPNSNIILRSLGDVSQKAKPDVVCHSIVEGETILLCTDGLCGVCTDKEIEEILSKETDDIISCKETLTEMALMADGSDNITIALLQIVEFNDKDRNNIIVTDCGIICKLKKLLPVKNIVLIILMLFIIVASYMAGLYRNGQEISNGTIEGYSDSVKICIRSDSIVSLKDTLTRNSIIIDNLNNNEGKKTQKIIDKKDITLQEQADEISMDPTVSSEEHSITTISKE